MKTMFNLLLMILSFQIMYSCNTEDRDEKFHTGQGENLEPKSKYDEKTYSAQTLQTVKVLNEDQVQGCSKIKVESKNLPILNELDWVTGKEGVNFQILTRIEQNHLYLYKILDKKDVLACEVISGDYQGKVLVPMAKYDIGLYTIESVKDLNGNPTGSKTEVVKPKEEADVVRIYKYTGRAFGEISFNSDLIPVHAFDKIFNNRTTIKTTTVDIETPSFKTINSDINTEKFTFYKNLNTVNYVVKKDIYGLLEDAVIYGKEEKDFNIEFKLQDRYIIVYKVSNDKDIVQLERDIAKKEGDQYYIPIRAYKVRYLKMQPQFDSKNMVAMNQSPKTVYEKSEATHFEIIRDTGKNFNLDPLSKQNLFPANFFSQGDFYYNKLAVDSSKSGIRKPITGISLTHDWVLGSVSKIRFRRIEGNNTIEFVDIKDPNETRRDFLRPLKDKFKDVERVVFRLRNNPSEFREQLVATNTDFQFDQNKVFYRIPFNKIDINHIDITDTYLSILTKESDWTKTVTQERMSFLLAPNKYIPGTKELIGKREYSLEDQRRFGYFTVDKPQKASLEVKDTDDVKYLTRFYPEFNKGKDKNKIYYYFSNNTPERWKNIVYESIDEWNKAFAKIQTPEKRIEIVIPKPNEAKYLGDIRYNLINIIDTNEDRLLGYGPSMADPHTGEIVTATANIYIDTMRTIKRNFLYQLLEFEIGLYDQTYFKPYKKREDNPFYKLNKFGINKVKVASACQKFLKYIDYRKKGNSAWETQKEFEVMTPCAEEIMMKELKKVIIHEMGHNLGLRHNFVGSMDRDEHRDKTHGKPFQGTTIMEYYPMNVDSLSVVGTYDTEALKYGYMEESKNLKKFKYCTDQDVPHYTEKGVLKSPECKRHDFGLNIADATEFKINQYRNWIISKFHRNGGANTLGNDSNGAGNGWATYLGFELQTLNKIYAHWRSRLQTFISSQEEYVTLDSEDLDNISNDKYFEILSRMSQEDLNYLEASKHIFQFFIEITMSNARHCVGVDQDTKDVKLVYLSRVRDNLYVNQGISSKYCHDKAVKQYLLDEKNLEYIGSVGAFLEPIYSTLDPSQKTQRKLEVVGLRTLRRGVSNLLLRGYESFSYANEPWFKEIYRNHLKEKLSLKTPNNKVLLPTLSFINQNANQINEGSNFDKYFGTGDSSSFYQKLSQANIVEFPYLYHDEDFIKRVFLFYRDSYKSEFSPEIAHANKQKFRGFSTRNIKSRTLVENISDAYEKAQKIEHGLSNEELSLEESELISTYYKPYEFVAGTELLTALKRNDLKDEESFFAKSFLEYIELKEKLDLELEENQTRDELAHDQLRLKTLWSILENGSGSFYEM